MKTIEIFSNTQSDEKKYFILDKARRLFHNIGIQSVSMDDIAKECGISKKTIYAHFENKSEIIGMVAETDNAEFDAALKNINSNACNPIDELKSLFKSLYSYHQRLSFVAINDLKKYHFEVYKKNSDLRKKKISKFLKRNISYGTKNGWYLPVEHIDKIIYTYLVFIEYILTEKEPSLITEYEAIFLGKSLINVLADLKGKNYLIEVANQ